MPMEFVDLIRGLNIRQRTVIWLGGVVLLLAILYPKMQTGYYVWYGNDWHLFCQAEKRMFVADAKFFGMPTEIREQGAAGYPEIESKLRMWPPVCVDRQDSIKVWNLALEMLSVLAITVGLAWVLKPAH
jgi:hypothetical protein